MKDAIKAVALIVGILLVVGGIIYGCYWIAKTVSYTLFYESMVQDTVREMVKKESLK